jgi:P4 family phage/plasmid primase-like protien
LVHQADGAFYPLQSGKFGIVKLNKSRSDSIIDTMLQYRHDPGYFKSPPLGINCENGFIALRCNLDGEFNAELEAHARRHRQRHIIKGCWPCRRSLEEKESSNFARYLNDTFRPDDDSREAKKDAQTRLKLCQEIAGAVATNYGTRVRSPKAIIFFSDEGATGKSTYLELMRGLANPEAVCSVPMSKFSDERYTVLLVGKVLNACDEISERAIKSDVFKRAITGEPLPGRDLYRSAISVIPVALHLFSTNTLPAFSGGIDGGVLRRLLPVTFPQRVPEDRRNPDLAETIRKQEADLLLEFAVHGAEELLKQLDYTVPPSSAELLKEWANESDPVRGWADECLEVTKDINEISCSRLYGNFCQWCEAHGIRRDFIIKQASFGRRLLSACPRLERYRRDTTWFRNARLRNT